MISEIGSFELLYKDLYWQKIVMEEYICVHNAFSNLYDLISQIQAVKFSKEKCSYGKVKPVE